MIKRTNWQHSVHDLTNLLEASTAVLANVWSSILPCSFTAGRV